MTSWRLTADPVQVPETRTECKLFNLDYKRRCFGTKLHNPDICLSSPVSLSGFYELSDGASGSLSNSSISVFSECFCSMADVDGRLLSAGKH